LAGLIRAPQFTTTPSATDITTDLVDVVVVPLSACGGKGVLHWAAQGATILAVAENRTTLELQPEALGLRVQRVENYLEALGAVMAMRAGVRAEALLAKSPLLKWV
jgi:branched-subunit amino acid ABC-type transport system permease component